MKNFKILRERELTESVNIEDLKSGTMNGSGLCCISNEACNKNEKKERPDMRQNPTQP